MSPVLFSVWILAALAFLIGAPGGDCERHHERCLGEHGARGRCREGVHCHKEGRCHPEDPRSPHGASAEHKKPRKHSETEDRHKGKKNMKIICYFPSWAGYRTGTAKFTPDDVDTTSCTHIMYSFSGLNSETLTMEPLDTWADISLGYYDKIVALKSKGVKVMISLGGWNESAGDKYSRLFNDAGARSRFITNVVQFLEKYGFEGLDLDYEYPKCWQGDCSLGPASDKDGFAALVRELSKEFKPRGWLLAAAVSANRKIIDQAYDVPVLSEYLDWIGFMGYDYHASWDGITGHIAPLYYYPGDEPVYFNVDAGISDWIERGARPEKMVLGMPFYGQAFTLADPQQHGMHAKTVGAGVNGSTPTFTEICVNAKAGGWKVVRDPEGRIGSYAYSGDQWVSYDDVEDIRRKCRYTKKRRLGGAMIWALGSDDFSNQCGCGRQPLLNTLGRELRKLPFKTKNCT